MKTIVFATALSLLFCNAATAQTNPLLGRWQIASAAVAPWIAPDKIHTMIKETDVRRFVKQRITFEADSVKSRDPIFACKGATYEPTRIPPEGLFQGGLPAPQGEIARALGLPDGPSPGVDVACPNSRFSYHLRDKDTALFALDNVIYTLKRR
jgi:hypothetical protein